MANESSDQTAHSRGLIRAFAVSLRNYIVLDVHFSYFCFSDSIKFPIWANSECTLPSFELCSSAQAGRDFHWFIQLELCTCICYLTLTQTFFRSILKHICLKAMIQMNPRNQILVHVSIQLPLAEMKRFKAPLKLLQLYEREHQNPVRSDVCAYNENSNQPALPRSLIKVFFVRRKKLCILSYSKYMRMRRLIRISAGRTFLT